MATNSMSHSSGSTSKAKRRDGSSVSPKSEGVREYELHEAAFHGNVSRVREVLKEKAVDVSAPDKHGEDGFTV